MPENPDRLSWPSHGKDATEEGSMNDAVEIEPTPAARHAGRFDASAEEPRVAAWVALPIGIAAATIGLAPWWISGARLPLQYLWESSVAARGDADRSAALQPVHRDPDLLRCSSSGAAVAGIAGRALRLRGWGLFSSFVGVLVVQAGATVQTARSCAKAFRIDSNRMSTSSELVAGTTLSILVGITVTVLIAERPVPAHCSA